MTLIDFWLICAKNHAIGNIIHDGISTGVVQITLVHGYGVSQSIAYEFGRHDSAFANLDEALDAATASFKGARHVH
jgi:hypothetical protein